MALATDFELHRALHLDSLKSLRGGVPEGLPAQLAEVTPILRVYDEAVATIRRDEGLSPKGKAAQLKAAHDTASAAIEAWKAKKTTGITAQVTAKRAAMQTKVDKNLPTPTGLQVQNMIQRLSAFDPLEVDVLYADATDTERRIIEVAAEAIGRQPIRQGDKIVWAPLIPPDRIAAVMEARIETANPEDVTQLRDLQRIGNTYETIAGSAIGLLAESMKPERV